MMATLGHMLRREGADHGVGDERAQTAEIDKFVRGVEGADVPQDPKISRIFWRFSR